MSKQTPHILIIDDEDTSSSLSSLLVTQGLAQAKVLHPQNVTQVDLERADLVLIDFVLDHWPERDQGTLPVTLKPVDGLALAALLRRHLREKEGDSPTAFAILTSQIRTLAVPLPHENREHLLARINNLEWVFQKSEGNLAEKVTSLARAVLSLPSSWSNGNVDGNVRKLASLLAVPKERGMRSRCLEDVESCTPPIHEISEWSHGLSVIRWLLQRILPYPCFLLDEIHLAARLRVDPGELKAHLLNPGSRLRRCLATAEYKGILSGFAGLRWWRKGVEHLLWVETEGNSMDPDALQQYVKKASRDRFTNFPSGEYPVVCVDGNHRPVEQLAPLSDAVRIRPDDWPPYADPAWVLIGNTKENRKLRALVVLDDREKLQ